MLYLIQNYDSLLCKTELLLVEQCVYRIVRNSSGYVAADAIEVVE